MNRADLEHLASRCRMGDPAAAAKAREILKAALKAPPGSPVREAARFLAACLKTRRVTRFGSLPQPGQGPKTELGRRLRAIFNRAGGKVHG